MLWYPFSDSQTPFRVLKCYTETVLILYARETWTINSHAENGNGDVFF